MSTLQISSILNPIVQEVNLLITQKVRLEEIKTYVIAEVEKHGKMNLLDRTNIVKKVKQLPTTLKLQKYLYDSLLKYEGYGVVKV